MKWFRRLLYFLSLSLITATTFSQLALTNHPPIKKTITNVETPATFIARLKYHTNSNGDSVFTLVLRNFLYSNIEATDSIEFVGNSLLLTDLYKLLNDVFDKQGKNQPIKLGNEVLVITSQGSHIKLTHGRYYGLLTKKQLNKLFARVDE